MIVWKHYTYLYQYVAADISYRRNARNRMNAKKTTAYSVCDVISEKYKNFRKKEEVLYNTLLSTQAPTMTTSSAVRRSNASHFIVYYKYNDTINRVYLLPDVFLRKTSSTPV